VEDQHHGCRMAFMLTRPSASREHQLHTYTQQSSPLTECCTHLRKRQTHNGLGPTRLQDATFFFLDVFVIKRQRKKKKEAQEFGQSLISAPSPGPWGISASLLNAVSSTCAVSPQIREQNKRARERALSLICSFMLLNAGPPRSLVIYHGPRYLPQ
jgi:hypothetical protein